MKEISLTKGYVAYVDDDDYEYLIKYKWRVNKQKHTSYAQKSNKYDIYLTMHRMVLKYTGDGVVDHIDGNGLNNQKNNLRICTQGENSMNKRKNKNNKTGYKGVRLHKCGKYVSGVYKNRKYYYLGLFDNKEDASKAYELKSAELFGDFKQKDF